MWEKDGTEIFYAEGDTLVVRPVTTASSFSAGPPTQLFRSARFRGRFMGADAPRAQYDISADGQRIVLPEPVDADTAIAPYNHVVGELGRNIRVVQNWFAEFRDRHGGSQ